MIRNLDTDTMVFGNEEEFWNELNASKHRCLDRIRKIPGIILNSPHSCWSFLISAIIGFTQLFLRHYIAVIVFYASFSTFIACILFLRGGKRMIAAIYCLSITFSSMIPLLKRGYIIIACKSRKESELQNLIEDFEHQNQPDANKLTGYGTKDKRKPLQGAVENLMEPRQGGTANPAMGCPQCCRTDDSPGPSSAPQCNCFTVTSYDSEDSDQPYQGPIVAHLHPDAIDLFGPPVHVFGAGAIEVVDDLDECACEKTNK